MFYRLLLTLFFISSISQASNRCLIQSLEQISEHVLEQNSSIQKIIEELLSKEYVNKVTGKKVASPLKLKVRDSSVAVISNDGEFMGLISYLKTKEGIIKGILVDIEPQFRRQGLSKLLSAKMFQENPKTSIISAVLIDDNLSVFTEVYNQTGDIEKALKSTPYYKVNSKLGFSKINPNKTKISRNLDGEFEVSITLER